MTARPRILVSFPFSEKGGWFIPLGEGCAMALEKLGFDVVRFNPVVDPLPRFFGHKFLERLAVLLGRIALQPKWKTKQYLPWNEEAIRFRRLLELARHRAPDYLLVISTYTYPARILRRLRKECGIRNTVGWCIEGPTWIRSPLKEATLYDHYFCIYPVPGGGSAGITHLSALAHDADLYRPLSPRPEKDVDVVFVGRSKARRVEVLTAILDFRPQIFGPGWAREAPTIAPYVSGEKIFGAELNHLYNRTKIVLNISAWNNDIADCPNLRIVDVPASGSFLLSDYSAAAAELFSEGREIEFYRNTEELRDKLRFYLANDAARERIARAGYERARRLGDYRDKMRTLVTESGIPFPDRTDPLAVAVETGAT